MKQGNFFRISVLAIFGGACGFLSHLPPIVIPTPTPVVTATPTASDTPSITPTFTPVPTVVPTQSPSATSTPQGTLVPPFVESFRGGLGVTPSYFKMGALTCAHGGSTIWFYMKNGVKTCDPRSIDRSPCDTDHFSCEAVKNNCNNRSYDDPRGPQIVISVGVEGKVIVSGNPYEYVVCAQPGPVKYYVCPKKNFHACEDSDSDEENCSKIPLVPRSGDGCSVHSFVFPKL